MGHTGTEKELAGIQDHPNPIFSFCQLPIYYKNKLEKLSHLFVFKIGGASAGLVIQAQARYGKADSTLTG